MLIPRIIPCLLLRRKGLVKTTKFKKPKYVGDPINALKIYNDKEVDEIIFLDIDASKNNQEPDYDYVSDLVTECFIPFSYGGGVKSLESIRKLLKIGVEKVIINSFAFEKPDFIKSAVQEFGSSTIIGAFDVKKNFFGKMLVYDHSKNDSKKLDPVTYGLKMQDMGVGEIFFNNVDLEGTYAGLDLNNIRKLSDQLSVPLIACGGARDLEDMVSAIKVGGASACAAGNLFVFQKPHNAVLISYPEREHLEELFK